MIPAGSSLRISSIEDVHGRTAENTCCSRMRRAISCVYCPPKSSTTTPPSSAFILPPCSCSCARFAICLAALSIMPSPLAFVALGLACPDSVGAPPACATLRRDSIICPARICVSRCFCRRDAAQLPDRRAPPFRLHLLRSPRRLSPCPAGGHSPAREFRLRPRASTPHQMPASLPSTIRPCAPASPKALPQDAASSAPASALPVPALPFESPAARLLPAAPANKSRWSAP